MVHQLRRECIDDRTIVIRGVARASVGAFRRDRCARAMSRAMGASRAHLMIRGTNVARDDDECRGVRSRL